MRKLIISALTALPFVLVLVNGCGEDEESFDNKAACENFFASYNSLDCVSDEAQVDPGSSCSGYTDTTVNCSQIFNCWASNMACEDIGGGIETVNNYTADCPTTCI